LLHFETNQHYRGKPKELQTPSQNGQPALNVPISLHEAARLTSSPKAHHHRQKENTNKPGALLTKLGNNYY